MPSDAEKIEAVLSALEVTPAELGRLLGRLPADLYKVRAGQRALSDGLKLRLHEVAGVNLEWLNTGIGPVLQSSARAEKLTLSAEEKRLIRFLRTHPGQWDVVRALMKAGD